MTILYFVIVFCMCVSRFNVIMTIMGDQLTRVEEINLLPFHSVRENLQYGRNPISWDMLYNMVMFVPFGIVIASEDNIEDEENYKTFKEKVVERTVKLDMEYRRIQQEMIEDYKTETSEYKEFLKKESPKLFQVFEESGSRNLRTFKSCLIDFERVYGLWHSLKLPTDGMGEAL